MSANATHQATPPAGAGTETPKPLPRRPLRQMTLDDSINQIGMAPSAHLVCCIVRPQTRDALVERAFERSTTPANLPAAPCEGGDVRAKSLEPEALLHSDEAELQERVKVLAGLCADLVRGVQHRSPESWAGEFLRLVPKKLANADAASVHGYFERAGRSVYAQKDPLCAELVTVAAAYAWKLRERDEKFTVPGSLNHTLRQLQPKDQAAWARNTAAFHVHSYDLENQSLSREKLEDNLTALLPK